MRIVQILLVWLAASSTAFAAELAKIQGAFGLKLGEPVSSEMIQSSSVNELGFEEVIFKPKHSIPPLIEYVAALTPKDKKVWMLVGAADISKEEDFTHFTEQFRKLVASKYGEMMPGEDNNSIDGQWTYIERPPSKRAIMVKFSRIDEKLLLTYVDLALHEQAKMELLEKKIETLDDSAF